MHIQAEIIYITHVLKYPITQVFFPPLLELTVSTGKQSRKTTEDKMRAPGKDLTQTRTAVAKGCAGNGSREVHISLSCSFRSQNFDSCLVLQFLVKSCNVYAFRTHTSVFGMVFIAQSIPIHSARPWYVSMGHHWVVGQELGRHYQTVTQTADITQQPHHGYYYYTVTDHKGSTCVATKH